VLNQALNGALGKYIDQTATTDLLTDMINTINNQLTHIQTEMMNDIASGTDYTALRNCIVSVVQQNGVEPGQRCLTASQLQSPLFK
jgi:hypothetical protein